MKAFFSGTNVAVTGAVGSVGLELVKQLLEMDVGSVRALDNDESGLFFLDHKYMKDNRLDAYLCDVRDRQTLTEALDRVDYVFHCAAYKHVPLSEKSPFEAVQTNIVAVQNLIEACRRAETKRVINASSDKAVNPTSVMGTSKLMGEKLVTAANTLGRRGVTRFSTTRFGNVAGSSGSVIPLFSEQIRSGGPVTLTDRRMTRFVMTLSEAATLLLESMTIAQGGEVFVMKMPVIQIQDLAEVMVELLASVFGHEPREIEIVEVGNRPGEKMFEELMNDEETRRAYDTGRFFTILPAFTNLYDTQPIEGLNSGAVPVDQRYISKDKNYLSKHELKEFLEQPGVLADEVREKLSEVRDR